MDGRRDRGYTPSDRQTLKFLASNEERVSLKPATALFFVDNQDFDSGKIRRAAFCLTL
jgi:hypothetical protein